MSQTYPLTYLFSEWPLTSYHLWVGHGHDAKCTRCIGRGFQTVTGVIRRGGSMPSCSTMGCWPNLMTLSYTELHLADF